MKKPNVALDFMALALQQAKAGNHVRAAKCIIQASREADANDALQIIEFSNAQAMKKLEASVKKPVAAKKAVKAEAEDGDDFDESIFDEDLQDDADVAEEDADAAEDDADAAEQAADDAEDEAEGDEDETEAMAMMASFFSQAAKQAKAAKAKKAAKK